MKFSICTDIMYKGLSFSQKIKEIEKSGFTAVEFWRWTDKNIDEIAKATENMEVVCFCIDSCDRNIMEKIGQYMLTSRHKEELKAAVIESVEIAKRIGTKALIAQVGDKVEGVSYDEQIKNVTESINYIKEIFEDNNLTLLIEPINRHERENYLIPNAKTVIDIVKQINSPNVKALYDIYHQEMEGDFAISEMVAELPYIGHIHVADVPNRNEPGSGRIGYEKVLKYLENAGYNGYIGAEYCPKIDEEKAFKILKTMI